MTDTQITELFYTQLEALCDDNEEGTGGTAAACTRAALMKKQISVWTLSDGISGLSMEEQQQNGTKFVDEVFTPLILQYVDSLMASEDSDADLTEQAMALLSALAVAYGESTSEAVADKAMEYSTVLLERVRCQACTLMGHLASHLLTKQHQSDDEEEASSWAEEWFDAIKDAMIPRISDKSQSVRHSAVQACANFFMDGSTEDKQGEEEMEGSNADDLLELVLWSMWHDPSAAIRASALESSPITNDTVAHIVSRIRDEKEKVRLQAIDVLKRKVDPTSGILGNEHFAEIVKGGLSSRCEATKRETERLICTKWMKTSKFNPVEMIRGMGASLYEDECEKVIEVVLRAVRSGDTDVLSGLSNPEIRAFQESGDEHMLELSDPFIEFDLEQIFFARIACCSAQTSEDLSPLQKENIINKIAPDIQVLCQLLARRIGMLVQATGDDDTSAEDTHSFICLQLLRLAQVAGLREEGSRRLFLSAIQEVLSSPETPDDLVEECVRSLRTAHDTEYDFFATISTTVTEISAVETNDSSSAMHLTLRNLIILTIVLENASVKMANHHTLDDFSDFIVDAARNDSCSPLVREAAVSALGRLGMLMSEASVVEVYKPTMLIIASDREEKLEIRSQALMALSDWSLLFQQVLLPYHFDDGRSTSLVDVISETLHHKNPTMMAFSAEVAAKLLLAGRISERDLVARLLVLFFDPNLLATETDEQVDGDEKEIGSPIRMQQVLSIFFPTYCIKSETGRDKMLVSIEAALRMASDGQSSSSKKSKKQKGSPFPYVKLIEFVCSMVDSGKQAAQVSDSEQPPSTPKNGSKKDEDSKLDTATPIIASIQVAQFLSKDNSLNLTETRALCKFLGSQDFEVSSENSYHLHALKETLEELGMVVSDSTCSRSIKAVCELLVDVPDHVLEEDDQGDDRSSQATDTEDEADIVNENDVSTGDTTVEEDSALMESMYALAVSKENVGRSSIGSRSSLEKGDDKGDRRSSRSRTAFSSHTNN